MTTATEHYEVSYVVMSQSCTRWEHAGGR